jgi:hypothetical protein
LAFRVDSREGARTLRVTRDADFETLLRQAGRPAKRPELPPLSEPTLEMIEALTRICAANGINIVGPPLG